MISAGSLKWEVSRQLGCAAERNPEFCTEDLLDAMKSGRNHADDGECMAGDGDGLASDFLVGVEAALPETGSQHNLGSALFALDEPASQHHGKLSDLKEIACDRLAIDSYWLPASAHRCRDQLEIGGHAGEGFGLVANIGVDGKREVVAALVAFVGGLEGEQGGRLAHGCRAKKEAADHGEDGGVGADA